MPRSRINPMIVITYINPINITSLIKNTLETTYVFLTKVVAIIESCRLKRTFTTVARNTLEKPSEKQNSLKNEY